VDGPGDHLGQPTDTCGQVADPADTPDMSGHTVETAARRVSSRLSGEGPALQLARRPQRATLAGQLLRHSLVTPEKKTLKRIEALRKDTFAAADTQPVFSSRFDHTGLRRAVDQHLAADRSLADALAGEPLALLAAALCDPTQASTAAATIVGRFLRAAGGIERSQNTPERVKAALQVLTDAVYDLDHATAPIPLAVRDVKIEKRDGGQQLVAILRHSADDVATVGVLRHTLQQAGYGDIDVRTERPVVVAPARPRSAATPW
jgi:hypothetical protein